MHLAQPLTAFFNPTVNSYRRINAPPTKSGASWSPSSISYTGNNRTHMIRVPDQVTLIYAGGVRDGADMAKALALGADAIAIGTGSMIALNCNKDIPEANFEKEMGVKAEECYHCHTGRCPVGVATQDPKLRARLNPDDAALRVYNYLHAMTL